MTLENKALNLPFHAFVMITKRIYVALMVLLSLSATNYVQGQTQLDDTPGKKNGKSWVPQAVESTRTPCQEIIAAFDTLQCIPIPQDTGVFFYFRVCLGDSVFFKVKGIYPDNGTYYTQHDTMSTYTWDFGDGTKYTTGEPFAWHRYDTAKGFEMNVFITDTNRCISLPLIARITVTRNPISQVNPLPAICVSDTTNLQASTFVSYSPFSYSQVSSQKFDSLMFIPDGPNCNPANPCYNTDVLFTSFLPGQMVTNASDILSVCVFMEHSYVGDMQFRLKCPNGQFSELKTYIHSGGADMGIPAFPDVGCKPTENPVGTPWNYCWSEIYPNIGTINANSSLPRLDSTDRTNNLKYYVPDSPFNNLIGCPLNGIWNIEICDYWAVDNGYIFEWTLNLSPALLPQSWGYTAEIDSSWVEGPFIIGTSGTGTLISPTAPGIYPYTVFIADNFGCVWDSTVYLEVKPLPGIDLGPDQEFCQGGQAVLDAGAGMQSYLWNTGATTRFLTVDQGGVYEVTITATNFCQNTDSVEITVFPLPAAVPIRHE